MKSRPTYLPPVKDKKRKQRSFVLAVFLLVLGLIVYSFYRDSQKKEELVSDLPTICGFDTQQTSKRLKEVNTSSTSEMGDYFYYGETLTLLKNTYVLGERDEYMGRQIRLTNLCDNQVVSFLLSGSLDGNIPVEELPAGFYLASVEIDLTDFYLTSEEPINDTFYTINRNQQQKKIEIMADEDYFVDTSVDEKLFNQNLVFIKVSDEQAPATVLDIMIDPAHNDQDFGPLDQGIIDGDFIEADALYDMAEQVQEKLEAYGLKVGITRNQGIILNTYGTPGRVYSAYESQSKIMIELDMVADTQGVDVIGSSYALLSLPEMIATKITDGSASLNSRLGTLDYHNLIRESGGYALGATQYSEISERLNQFAKENRHGTQTLSIQFQDFESVDAMVEAIVTGLIDYINIES